MRIPAQLQTVITLAIMVVLCAGCATDPTAAFIADETTITAGEFSSPISPSMNLPHGYGHSREALLLHQTCKIR